MLIAQMRSAELWSPGIYGSEMTGVLIQIAKDFSRFPGGRFVSDGPHSGELFRQEALIPSLRGKADLIIDLDGVAGLPASFLEEAFGGLIRAGFTQTDLKSRMKIIATTSRLQRYPDQIWSYIESAAASSNRVS